MVNEENTPPEPPCGGASCFGGDSRMDSKARGVHLHLNYVYTCENPLFNGGGGIYLPLMNIFHPISS